MRRTIPIGARIKPKRVGLLVAYPHTQKDELRMETSEYTKMFRRIKTFLGFFKRKL